MRQREQRQPQLRQLRRRRRRRQRRRRKHLQQGQSRSSIDWRRHTGSRCTKRYRLPTWRVWLATGHCLGLLQAMDAWLNRAHRCSPRRLRGHCSSPPHFPSSNRPAMQAAGCASAGAAMDVGSVIARDCRAREVPVLSSVLDLRTTQTFKPKRPQNARSTVRTPVSKFRH